MAPRPPTLATSDREPLSFARWMRTLSSSSDPRNFDARTVGGKGARLYFLSANGFHVPATWVIPNAAFTEALRALPPACEPRSLLRAATGRTVYARAAEARQEILRVALPAGLEDELAALWADVGQDCPWGLAVRSSATCEDGALVSMAGLAETRLGVRGPEALVQAVRDVWASVASGRALVYLATHGVRDLGMAVVIQRVVPAVSAGVLFTRAPDGRRERIVNSSFGLGATVVDGSAAPDVFRLNDAGDVAARTIARKTSMLEVGADGPLRSTPAAPDAPSVADAQLRELGVIASRLEAIENIGWDAEFVWDGASVWLVQARPITQRGFPDGGDERTVWSRVNVGEALPGVATPFTWSVAGAFSESGFRKAFATLGCKVPKNAKLVGNVHGRFYLNLTEFMRISAQVPWLRPQTLLEAGGGQGVQELDLQITGVSHKGFFARLPLTISRLGKEQLRLDAEVAAFEVLAERTLRAHRSLDLRILPDDAIVRTLRGVQGFLEQAGNAMLTSASSSLGMHVVLKALLDRYQPGDGERLAHGIVAGVRDLESTRPAIGIARIVEVARRDPAAKAAFERSHGAPRSLADVPEGPTRRALQSFLDSYGDRAVREAELSTPRWREDPQAVLTMIRIAMLGGGREVDRAQDHAQQVADAAMAEVLPRLGPGVDTILRHMVARAQKAARYRERLRAWVTRALGMVRQVALEADVRLARLSPELSADRAALEQAKSPLAQVPSVFFLTVDEVNQALRGGRTDLAPLVRARRAEHARDVARAEPPITFVGVPSTIVMPAEGGARLTGLGASSGVVEGKARVLRRIDELEALVPGEIIVAPTTDVGWTPLFLLAAGVVTELGGPLSHAAVVAREFGVPSVVNVEGVTRAVRTGDRLRIDGDRGTVDLLPRDT
jgi:phosphohistidine swiveling domain-containing protein